jgi:hypothetical protein
MCSGKRRTRRLTVAAKINNHAGLIWAIADLLRRDYKPSESQRVILPLVRKSSRFPTVIAGCETGGASVSSSGERGGG